MKRTYKISVFVEVETYPLLTKEELNEQTLERIQDSVKNSLDLSDEVYDVWLGEAQITHTEIEDTTAE